MLLRARLVAALTAMWRQANATPEMIVWALCLTGTSGRCALLRAAYW